MSGDNGIYIAEFPDGFRVIHAQAIENLAYFEEGTKAWKDEIRTYFKDTKLFTKKSERRITNILHWSQQHRIIFNFYFTYFKHFSEKNK